LRLTFTIPAAALLAAGALVFPHGSERPLQAAGVCTPGGESQVTKFGQWFSPDVTLDAGALSAPGLVPTGLTGTAAVRLQIEATNPSGQHFSLILRDVRQRILAVLTEQEFGVAAGGTQTQWTGRLEANQVSAQLVGAAPGTSLAFLSGLALPKDSAGVNVFSIQHDQPSWQDPYSRNELVYQHAAEAVGMLMSGVKLPDANNVLQKETWCCSGAMLTSDIFITNWHCGGAKTLADANYWSDPVRSNTVMDLGWQSGAAPRRQFGVSKVLYANERLDFALLRVRPIVGPGAATGRAPPVKVALQLPADGQIFLVHHAQCQMKLVSFNCRIDKTSYPAWTDPRPQSSGPDITHDCDTEPGASGAPVFDMQGRMIALHHLGFQRPGAGPQCPADTANKAVTMASIFADVQAKQPALYTELMRH
jgi:hypothetical protein